MEQQLNFLIEHGRIWIISQREANRKLSIPLSQKEKEQLQPFFQPETLDSVRVRKVLQINNPDFYEDFEKSGQPIPLDFREMEGITFINTVLIAEPKIISSNWRPLLFHECVHVCQYKLLGVEKFVEEYVNGWASNDYTYENIPLEEQAYGLESKFKENPHGPFNVESIVKNRWKHLIL